MKAFLTIFITCLILIDFAGCASNRNKLGHLWDYQTPAYVKEADQLECEKLSEKSVTDYFNQIPDWPLVILGPISVIIGIIWVVQKRNTLYENAMKACLMERGYQ